MIVSIVGNGGFARELKSYLKQSGIQFNTFVSDDYYIGEPDVYRLGELNMNNPVLIAIADVNAKRKIVESLPLGIDYFTFIHPSAQIYTEHKIGEGTIIGPNVVITTNVVIGKHSLINCNTTVGHDTIILDYFTANPNSAISGNCEIGSEVFVGSSSCIREKIKVTNRVTIGMGTTVVKNIEHSGIYVGTPARELIK